MKKEFVFRDSRGDKVEVGDNVMIYFGYNRLLPGVVKQIQGMGAKVLVDAWPTHPNPEFRYSLSKWKRGDCMVKVPSVTKEYPPEVVLLISEILRLRDEAPMTKEGLPTRKVCQDLLNFWDMKRPMNLVTS